MNGGVLQFSLGLATGSFISAVEKAGSKIRGLAGSALSLPGLGVALGGAVASISSLHAVIEGVFGAIQRGAELEQLSRRTQTSVASLFELQKGFKAVGLSADDVGPMIFKMQKSLGGINEMGEDTKDVFFRMGLNLSDLKKLDAPKQFQAIATAMSKLNASGAAAAGSAIFGREGAGNMVQLSNSTNEFAAALQRAQHDAQVFQRNSESFAILERSLDAVKNKTKTLFAGMAEGAAPAIQAITDKLNAIDLSALGERIGKIFTVLTEAFREGKLIDLIVLSIKTGFEVGMEFVPGLLEKLGATLLQIFETPLMYLQAGLTWLTLQMGEWLDKFEGSLPKAIQKAIGYNPDNVMHTMGKAPSFGDVLKDREDEGVKFGGLTPNSQFGTKDIQADADSRINAAKDQMGVIAAPLMAMAKGLMANAPKPQGGKVGPDHSKSGDNLIPEKSEYKPEFTSFEKMGFVMGGANNPMLDATKRQTTAVQQLTTVMRQVASAHQATAKTYDGKAIGGLLVAIGSTKSMNQL